jgi:hypothetical protein
LRKTLNDGTNFYSNDSSNNGDEVSAFKWSRKLKKKKAPTNVDAPSKGRERWSPPERHKSKIMNVN